MLAGLATPAAAADETWVAPADASGDWDDNANWDTNDAPSTFTDTAVFNTGHLVNLTTVTFIDGIRYDASADSGTITVGADVLLSLSGAGIVNNSFNTQTIRFAGSNGFLEFSNTAGVTSGTGAAVAIEIGRFTSAYFNGLSDAAAGDFNLADQGVLFSQVDDGTLTLGALSGSGFVTGNSKNGSVPALQTISVGALNTSTTFSGMILDHVGFGVVVALDKVGTGTLTLTGANTYSGGTTVTDGLINFTTGDNLGTGNITLNGGGLQWEMGSTLDISSRLNPLGASGGTFDTNGNDVTLASVIEGGALTKAGAGVLTLTAANTYTGGTTVTGGLINFSDETNFGTGNITLLGGGLQWASGSTVDISDRLANVIGGTFDTNGNDVTLASSISGFGIAKTGAGTLTLAGSSSYGGETAIYGGTVSFTDGSNFGSSFVLLDGGTLRWEPGSSFDISTRLSPLGEGGGTFDTNGNDVTFAEGVTGQGGLTKAGAGTLVLTDATYVPGWNATYVGATWITGGTLQLGDGVTGGALGMGDVFNDGTLVFSLLHDRLDEFGLPISGVGLFENAISGAGMVVQDGTGIVILTGENSYSGTTFINSGTLQVGDGGWGGTLGTGDVVNSGNLAFNRSGELTISGSIAGPGTVSLTGPGTVIFTGNNIYTGDTTISSGTLQVGDGGTSGTLGPGLVINDGDLVFNRSDDIAFTGELDGSGNLTKLGAGTLTLTGNSANNDYQGTTSILGGTLETDNNGLGLTSLVEIGNGATLRAIGDFGLFADVAILEGGGTIDTGAGFFDVFGSVDFGDTLTKTGSGVLILDDYPGLGSGDGGVNVLEGTLALGIEGAAGTGTIFLADGTTLANAACGCGLYIDNDIAVAPEGTATLDGAGSYFTALEGAVSGGNIHFISSPSGDEGGYSEFWLNGENTYGDSIIGANVGLVVLDGTLGNGNTSFEDVPSDPQTPAMLIFAKAEDYTYNGTISGDGDILIFSMPGSGARITLGGSNSSGNNFTGNVFVEEGQLAINGQFGDIDGNSATLLVDGCACDLAKLSGSGTFYGSVEIGMGTVEAGNSPGTLNIAGNLTLGAVTVLNYEFGQPGVVGSNINDLVTVGGAFTLDGTLNVLDFGPSYGPGYYRLFNYAGTLTDNGLVMGSIDGAYSTELLFNINGQVNLRLGAQVDQYWDGTDTTGASTATTGNGGAGTWTASGTNWTAASGYGINDQWRSTVGVFAGASGGTVTVDFTQNFEGLRFETDGYLLQGGLLGGALGVTGAASTITVSPGVTANIGIGIEGAAGLIKAGDGTLLLSGTSSYSGGTAINAGTLQMGTLFALPGTTIVDVAAGGTLDLNDFSLAIGALTGNGTVASGSGDFNIGASGASGTFDGSITGTGSLNKFGTGTQELSFAVMVGRADVYDGTLSLLVGGTIEASEMLIHGTFLNAGGVTANVGTGVTGNIDNSGSIVGNVEVQSTLTSSGSIIGNLNVTSSGNASLQGILNGDVTNGGVVSLAGTTTGIGRFSQTGGGSFNLNSIDTTIGSLDGDGQVNLGNAQLTTGGDGSSTDFFGVISGSGGLTKVGDGTFVFGNINTYSGQTAVGEGTLRLGINNALTDPTALDVAAGATFDLAGFTTHVGSLSGAGAVTLNGGRLDTGYNNSSTTFSGTMTGPNGGTSAFTKNGSGTLTLSGSIALGDGAGALNSFGQVNAGTLQITSTGSISSDLLQNFSTIDNSGAITAFSSFQTFATVTNNATGTIVGNTQNFSTFDNFGTMGGLQSLGGTATNAGTINGNVQNFASFTSTGIINGSVSNFSTALIEGQLNGEAANLQAGSTITLTGITTGITNYRGVAGSTLDLANFSTTVGALNANGSILIGTGTLTVDSQRPFSDFGGDISGSGGLIKTGVGEQVLSGVNTYGGLTTVSGGSLTVGSGGSLAGGVQNDATFLNDGTVAGALTNTGGASNSGTIAGGVTNSGTFDSTGTIGLGVVNYTTMSASGQINGSVQNFGTFALTGALTGITSYSQQPLGQLDLAGYDLTTSVFSGGGSVTLGGGTLTTGGSNLSTTFSGVISGDGGLTKVGTGVFTLAGANTYTGTTTISGGILWVGPNGGLGGGDIVDNGVLLLDHNGVMTINGVLTGSGAVIKTGTGSLEFAGDNTPGNDFTGTIQVINNGLLILNGRVGDTAGNTAQLTMDAGTQLRGSGTFYGSAAINGSLGAGNSPGTLTIAGDLTLSGSSILDYEFGASGTPGGPNNDLVAVGGNLTLDGTLNVLPAGAGYGAGYYRLFDYGGTLTDNGLTIGAISNGLSATILTNINNQVNVVLGPQLVQYWDGGDMTGASAAVNGDGGSGTWNAANTNWTSPAGFGINDQWRSQIGVFAGTAGGTVNVSGTQAFQELRFQTDGYVLTGTAGNRLATTAGFSVVQVDSGVAAGIGVEISGTAGLTKTGAGTLTLSRVNSYTGTTTVSAGTLVNAGTLVGPVVNLASFVSTGTITGMPVAGSFTNSGTAWLQGTIQGDITNLAGTVTFTGATDGIRVFSQSAGAATVIGATPVSFAALTGEGTIDLGTDLSVGAFGLSTVFAGTISGSGGLTKVGSGAFTLSGVNSYTGTTTVSGGRLNNLGTLAGPVVNSANFDNQGIVGGDVFNSASGVFASTGTINGNLDNYGSASLAGRLNGQISNQGNILLTGTTVGISLLNNRFTTSVADLNGFDTTLGSLVGDGQLRLGSALLTVGSANVYNQFRGVISGTGGLTKVGTNVLTLDGANTYTGPTTISSGILLLSSSGRIAGDVNNNARFENEGTVTGWLTNTSVARNEGTLNGGILNSGTLDTLGTINGNVLNSGTVYAEGALNGAIVNDGYVQLTGSLSGVTEITQGVDGTLIVGGETFAVGALNGSGYVELGGGLLEVGSGGANSQFDGEIYGDGALTKVGAGTLTLTGFTGFDGTTTVSEGTLRNTGTLYGPILNWATFASTGVVNGDLDNRFGSVTLEGQLNGAIENYGDITLTGTTTGIGELFLSDWATFNLNGFDTTVGSTFGPGSIQLGSATLTTGGNNLSTWVSGVISGSGRLTKVGTGDMILAAANTYTGLTTISGGSIYLDATGSLAGAVRNDATFFNRGTVAGLLTSSGTSTNLGSLNGGVINSGALDTQGVINGNLVNSGTVTARGVINGTVANSGRLTLTGATTGIGAFTQTAAGTFALGGFSTTIGSLAGAGAIQLGNATLTTNGDNSSTAFAGVISGSSGALTKVGTGTLVLSGANTFTGPTTITGGTLQLGNGGTGGSLASSSIVDNGLLAINRSDLLQISAAISGSGSLVQAGTGTTRLTGANTYTGGTLVSAGRLIGDTTSLRGAIQANGTVEFAQAAAGTYTGSLTGTGAFEKTAGGLLNLTGDNSAFTGVTRVLGGQLAVNGLLTRSVVTVGPGATLLGVGPIGGLIAQAGSFVAPGNSVGTLQVNGNVQLLAGSTYQAEIAPAAADLINATGTAQVAGTLQVINLGGTYTLGTTYVLVNAAGGRTGTFDATTGLGSFGPRIRARVVYTPTQVQLLMAPNLLAAIACSTPTRNQASFMAGFDAAVQGGSYNPQALEALYNLDPAGVCRAADQLSGGVYPAAASVALEEERLIREAAIDRLRFAQDGEATGTGVWGQLVGAWGHVNSDGTGFDVDNNREGVIFGVDTGGAGWRVGIYAHHIETELDADALASEAHLDRNGLGAYAGFTSGGFRARGGVSYSDLELSTTRTIAFPGFSAATSGKGDGSMIQGFGELAYRFDVGNETFLEPFADVALATVDLDAINETGSAAAQLRVEEQEHDIGRAIAGLRGDAAIQTGSTRLRLGIDAGLQHNFGDRSIATLIALDGAPQYPFMVRAAEIEPWAFVGGGRVAIDFGSNVTATVAYRGVLAGNRNDHAASATLSVKF